MLKKQILGLFFGLLSASGVCAQPFDWYVAKSNPAMIDKIAAQEIYVSLETGDNQNVAIVEYLLKKVQQNYDILSSQFKSKVADLRKLLNVTSEISASILNYIEVQTGFAEPAVRQRLLNNLVLLERLLVILGQDHELDVKSSLFDKQEVLRGLGTTNKLLELLLDSGYTQDQLVAFIRNSNENIPAKSGRKNGLIMTDSSAKVHIPREIKVEIEKDLSTFMSMYLRAEDVTDVKNEANELAAPLSDKDLNYVLGVIESISPFLYFSLLTVGANKYIRSYDGVIAAVGCWKNGSLPHILIAPDFMKTSFASQRFTMAHEIGHYILGHISNDTSKFKHKRFREIILGFLKKNGLVEGLSQDEIEKKIDSCRDYMQHVFDNSRSRIQEYEADRFAVVNMGVPIADGVASFLEDQEIIKSIKENDKDALFPEDVALWRQSHPVLSTRIAHLESLAPEVELCKQGKISCEVNWEKAIKACRARWQNE